MRAATTSKREERIKTISAASMATGVPEERAMPTEAATKAGESLIPSPTYAAQNQSINKRMLQKQKKKQKGGEGVRTIATPPPYCSINSPTLLAFPFGLILAQTFSFLIPTCLATA